MNPTVRNVVALIAAFVTGWVAIGITVGVQYGTGAPRESSGLSGYLGMRAIELGPWLIFAVVFGLVAAVLVANPRSRHWPGIVGAIAACYKGSSIRFIAPDVQEWGITASECMLVGIAAAVVFSLVARRRGKRPLQVTPAGMR
ncbi:MAG TPA: hypothetical protein VEK11_17770 [Thermoanaerobaculia bacterium]|nr:hypothetical protein [Thermoanaerobaculia bacterium]